MENSLLVIFDEIWRGMGDEGVISEPIFGKTMGYSLCFFFKNWPVFKMLIT